MLAWRGADGLPGRGMRLQGGPAMEHLKEHLEKNWRFLAVLAVLAILAVLLVVLVAILFYAYGEDFGRAVSTDNKAVNILAAIYFIANTFLAAIAVGALGFAYAQFTSLRVQNDLILRSNRASSYVEINEKYNHPDVTYSRLKLVRIRHYYNANESLHKAHGSVGKFAHTLLLAERADSLERVKSGRQEAITGLRAEYNKTLALLSFLEDLGVLSAKGYIQKEDIFDFMGGVIVEVEKILGDHIQYIRNLANDSTTYANALQLMKDARIHRASKKMIEFTDAPYALAGAES
jgi:hypothetical protein